MENEMEALILQELGQYLSPFHIHIVSPCNVLCSVHPLLMAWGLVILNILF